MTRAEIIKALKAKKWALTKGSWYHQSRAMLRQGVSLREAASWEGFSTTDDLSSNPKPKKKFDKKRCPKLPDWVKKGVYCHVMGEAQDIFKIVGFEYYEAGKKHYHTVALVEDLMGSVCAENADKLVEASISQVEFDTALSVAILEAGRKNPLDPKRRLTLLTKVISVLKDSAIRYGDAAFEGEPEEIAKKILHE